MDTPRADVLRGWSRRRWLWQQRRTGRMIDPTVRVQGMVESITEQLQLGTGSHLDQGVILWIGEKLGRIVVGENVYIGQYSFLGSSSHRLEIGDHVMIGAQSYIITENHSVRRKDIPYSSQGYEGADVRIGRNVWLGCHVVVLPGVTIGENAIIGAGAVVTKSVPPGETWAGVPARPIGKKGESETL